MLLGVVHSVWLDLATSLAKLIPGNVVLAWQVHRTNRIHGSQSDFAPRTWVAGIPSVLSSFEHVLEQMLRRVRAVRTGPASSATRR